MQHLNFYTTLFKNMLQSAPDQAEHLQEEVNIFIHKLKFISQDQRPAVLILAQQTGFEPLINEQIVESVAIAGGKLLTEKYENPSILILVQENNKLYTAVPELIQDEILSRTTAVESNHIFIIQKTDFGTNPHNFLHDTEICAEIIQPKYFIYGHKGTDWVQFDIA